MSVLQPNEVRRGCSLSLPVPVGGSWIAFDMSDDMLSREIMFFITASCIILSKGITSQYLTNSLMYVLDAEVSGYHLYIIMRVE